MLNDPKWRVVAQKSNTRVCEVVAVALAILNSASQNDERGVYSIEAEDIAAALDIDEEAVGKILVAMEGRFVSGGKVIQWEKRQPKREDNATERTRAWRERNRTQCDAPVTQCDAPEKIREDTDTEKRREEYSNGFEVFWNEWGSHHRRTDKKHCYAKWERYQLEPIKDVVLSALEAWKQSPDWKKEGGRFIPAPLVWLNGRRWETPPQVKRNEWEEMLNGVESAF